MSQTPGDITLQALWPTVVLQARFTESLEAMTREVYRLNALPDAGIVLDKYTSFIASLGLVVVFGTLGMVTNDPRFLEIKPTIILGGDTITDVSLDAVP